MSSTQHSTEQSTRVERKRGAVQERERVLRESFREEATSKKLPSEERPPPSESPEIRIVAGHVARRSRVYARAATPPPSSAAKAKARTESSVDKGKGRQSKGIGGDDGSDSDEEGRHHSRQDNDETKLSYRRPPPVAASEGSVSGHASVLTAEEQGRIKLHRTLQDLEDLWKDIKRHREDCEERRPEREITLIQNYLYDQHLLSNNTEYYEAVAEIKEEDKRLLAFKDKVIAGGLEANLKEMEQAILETRFDETERRCLQEEVINKVDAGVIARCGVFDGKNPATAWGTSWETPPPTRGERLGWVVRGMYVGLWRELVEEKRPAVQDIAKATASFIKTQCPITYPDTLVEQYIDRVSKSLADTIMREYEAGLPSNPSNLGLRHMIADSRCNARLSDEYFAWVTSLLDPHELDTSVRRFHQLHLEDQVREARRTTSEIWGTITGGLEFIEDYPNDVSVVLFKGNRPFSRQLVPVEDLTHMGWRRSVLTSFNPLGACPPKYSPYWRYRHSCGQIFEYIFKVQMDGEVIGIWTPGGDIDWYPGMAKKEKSEKVGYLISHV
jgi:hypothetical protein